MEGARVFKDRPYTMSAAMQKVVEDEIDKMLELGVIEETKSPWSNRTTVVSRPEEDRCCLDARKLNALTIKDAYPLPCIEGILSKGISLRRITSPALTSSLRFGRLNWTTEARSTLCSRFQAGRCTSFE